MPIESAQQDSGQALRDHHIKVFLQRRRSYSDKQAARAATHRRVQQLSVTEERELAQRLAASRKKSIRASSSAAGHDPLHRDFRRFKRPLRSKPLSRRARQLQGLDASRRPNKRPKDAKKLDDKPLALITNQVYEKDGWYCCGFCGVSVNSRLNFAEHEQSARHQRSVSLVNIRDDCCCPCGKKFNNKLHAYRHYLKCSDGKKLL